MTIRRQAKAGSARAARRRAARRGGARGSARTGRKPRGEGYLRRGEILAAARQLFLKEGVERVTIRAICGRVGITPPALYRHFKDKRELMIAICNETFGKLLEAFRAIRARPGDPIANFVGMMETYVRFALDHPDQYRLTFLVKEFLDETIVGTPHDDEAVIAMGIVGPLVARELAAQIASCMEAGLLARGDPMLVCETVWALGHGLVSLLIVNPHFLDHDREALLKSTIAMALDGLRPRG